MNSGQTQSRSSYLAGVSDNFSIYTVSALYDAEMHSSVMQCPAAMGAGEMQELRLKNGFWGRGCGGSPLLQKGWPPQKSGARSHARLITNIDYDLTFQAPMPLIGAP